MLHVRYGILDTSTLGSRVACECLYRYRYRYTGRYCCTDCRTDSFTGSYSMCFLVVACVEWLFVSACLRLLGLCGCLCSSVAAWIEWLPDANVQIEMWLQLSYYSSNVSSSCKWAARWMLPVRAVIVVPWVQMLLPSHLSTLSLGTSYLLCPMKRQDRRCAVSRRWIHTRRSMGEVTSWRPMGAPRVSAELV